MSIFSRIILRLPQRAMRELSGRFTGIRAWSLCAVLCGMCSTMPQASAAPPLIDLPAAGISSATAPPNLVLDISNEFPDIGSAYIHQVYAPSRAYIGYFDPNRCYVYTGTSTYILGVYDNSNDDTRYFKEAGAADALHRCTGKFSGNFMNWATSSVIDIFRFSMAGGDRVIDEVGKTILQRANLPTLYPSRLYDFPPVVLSGIEGVSSSDVTPFSVPVLHMVSCKNRVQFSTNLPVPPTNTPEFESGKPCDVQGSTDKSLGEYVVRVEVCSDASGAARLGLCQKYGTHYKPEGEIQRNAERMHFAVFSYLNDSDARRYGGVLRAPMKYVGLNRFDDVTLQKSVNPNAEWDAITGIFKPDPDPDGTTISGVINFLTKFGRSGVYRRDDPVAELYYESVRYLQGLQPTPEAIANLTPAFRDGFPVVTTWKDPIAASCQKNTVLLIADANTHHEFYIPGNTRIGYEHGPGSNIVDGPRPVDSTSNPPLDIMAFTHRVGVMETTTHGVDVKIRPRLANLETQSTGDFQSGGFEGNYYLAGAAYWANTSNIRTDKLNISAQTYIIDVDEGGSGVISDDPAARSLTPIRDSQLYLAAKFGAFRPQANPAIPNDPTDPYWPIPTASSPKSPAGCYGYLWDPNGSCDPPNYFLGSDGTRFSQAVKNVFALLQNPGEAVTQVGASSLTVTQGTTQFIYQGRFTTPGWGGDVQRIPVTYDPASGLTIGKAGVETPTIALKEPDWPVPQAGAFVAPRKIYTYNTIANPTSNSTVPFQWGTLSGAQQTILNGSDTLGEARLHYLRGSTNNELNPLAGTGQFRPRPKTVTGMTNILGDILHSSPVYVGAPTLQVQGAGYQAFYSAYASRAPTVYVGANDGMLHAFAADLSKEYFAYVPAMAVPALPALTQIDYVHQPYVDGSISVAEAKVGGQWKSVLAATMGGGAQGVFALDVTDPQNFSPTSGALFEFSDADDADMGNVFGAPVIAKFNRAASGVTPVYEYFVVVSSGVNNYKADGAVGTSPGGALFLLSLEKTAGAPWQRNVNYFKLPIPNSDVDVARQAGLSPPGLATSNDGAVTTAYAGDLQGQLWRFDFSKATSLASTTADKLFTAVDAGGNRQAITTPPAIVFAPNGGNLVLFGTGKYLESTDLRTSVQDSMYGIFDSLEKTYTVSGRNVLAKRTLAGGIDAAQLSLTGEAFAYFGLGAKQGWYFDFANTVSTGERVVTPPQLGFGQVIFNSLLPLPAVASCPVASGGRSYSINTLTGLAGASGSATGTLSNVGILSAPLVLTTRAAVATAVAPNAIGRKIVQQKYSIATVGSGGVAPAVNQQADQVAGRLSWREIFNYQGL